MREVILFFRRDVNWFTSPFYPLLIRKAVLLCNIKMSIMGMLQNYLLGLLFSTIE